MDAPKFAPKQRVRIDAFPTDVNVANDPKHKAPKGVVLAVKSGANGFEYDITTDWDGTIAGVAEARITPTLD